MPARAGTLLARDRRSVQHHASIAVFIAQVVALLVAGRLVGELLQRAGQSAIMGQLMGGILLGPSVLGFLWPGLERSLFPTLPEQHAMLDAVAQLGILLLLLLTGMETDLGVIRHSRRAALSVSIAGIALPFACGIGVGLLLPPALLPDPGRRFVTTLFLGTALSISSVKIVALLVRELGFLRRTVGQVIVAAAVVDDTIGWIIMSVTFGLALHGTIDLVTVSRTVLGMVAFIVAGFTIGRRLVFQLIRWSNDHFISELPVITMILVIMGLLALLTDAIGVHTVLGAFVAGILVGQSPILTRHIAEELRGLIVGLFMPVFFGTAGLSTNLEALARPDLLLLTATLIVIASIGKFSGAVLGGRVAGLSFAQAVAIGSGMNARGSTEVIIASIGLSMGVLNQSLFTAIVAMAVVTTLSMPPMLRWALARLPLSHEEETRLERDKLEARGFVAHLERLLVAADASPSGQLASHLSGLLAGVRGLPTTAVHFDYTGAASLPGAERQAHRTEDVLQDAVETGGQADSGAENATVTLRVEDPQPAEAAISQAAEKGYGLLFIGREPASEGDRFHVQITRTAVRFGGPFAVVIARGEHRERNIQAPLRILVPVNGTASSRHGAELAISLARAAGGSVTALHLASRFGERRGWRERPGELLGADTNADLIIRDVIQLGKAYNVNVRGAVRSRRTAENAILQAIRLERYNLVVMGVTPRLGDELFFGDVAAELLARAQCSLLFVASEAADLAHFNDVDNPALETTPARPQTPVAEPASGTRAR
jgi:Kef-type K+ transport system membrane component KefB/nucleotide-binding universal stress UspA family protein